MTKTSNHNASLNHQLKEKLDMINDEFLSHHCEKLAQSSNASEYDKTHQKLDALLQKKALLHSMEELLVKAQKVGNHPLATRLTEFIQKVTEQGDFESFYDFVDTPIGQALIAQNHDVTWRSPCPLCHAEPFSVASGFLIPGGLRMHLEGGNKAHKCAVRQAIDDFYLERTGEHPWNNWRY
ncbi:hypothetical protein [Vibrio hangzhouensis]|uniref:Uncharacterized protein n=1 Tax=Vibrio hangzhouensis TaxID=462991 RepID=A0A1H6AEA4_9VIBR|nr:hypothetical protein [Vibrio hangzhouensis]SEG46712.1 hypothetical protein SAMN04488244_11524 [Vibrio hangzhouensis]